MISEGFFLCPHYYCDHLGSASWIMNQNATAGQYIHYAPYGSLVANQRLGGYDERFKFTGKERDGESGYDYFGARYYTPPLGIWISVDPLTDKYPNVTSYLYCNGNPIMLVDPNGKRFKTFDDECIASDIYDAASDRVRINQKRMDYYQAHPTKHEWRQKIRDRNIKRMEKENQLMSDLMNGIDAIRGCEQVYTYNHVPAEEGVNVVKLEKRGDEIVINHLGTLGSKSHETMHAIQHYIGMFRFSGDGTEVIFNGVSQLEVEQDAWRVQYILDRQSMENIPSPKGLDGIDANWFEEVNNHTGQHIYGK